MWIEYYSIEKGGLSVFLHPLLGLIFSLLGPYLLVRAIRSNDPAERGGCALVFLSAWTLFAWVWTIGFYTDIWLDYSRLRAVLDANRCQMLEGQVDSVKTWQTRQGMAERISIGGLDFQYSSGGVNPAFNQTCSQHGPMAPGLRVKFCHFEGKILKLWVWSEQE